MFNLSNVQKKIREKGLDGWLLYDHHGSNRFVKELLLIPENKLLTRRFFYWIPVEGRPVKILHRIEEESMEETPGEVRLYLSWKELQEALKETLQGAKKIAMEYSPENANPYVSMVDAGTVEWFRKKGIEIFSSAELLQHFTSVLNEAQISSHLFAAKTLENTFASAWHLITDHIKKGKGLTEYDVQQFILGEFAAAGCVTEGFPICAVNEHSALPHYCPSQKGCKAIKEGDFILIDLWCKQDLQASVFADITRVCFAGKTPSQKHKEVFEIVKSAQNAATDLVRVRFSQKKDVLGAEVDDACRQVIQEAGYGKFFTHRTGHSIDTSLHGGGAHLDHFETDDRRKILAGTVFSVEPGIYLPGEFGVRLEYDILVKLDSSIHVTGGSQESLFHL